MDEDDIARKYAELIREFTDGELSAPEFATRYLEAFKDEDSPVSDELFWALQNLFAEADAYSGDPELRGQRGIGEAELREAALETLRRLDELEGSTGDG